jgi:hypothetical protein
MSGIAIWLTIQIVEVVGCAMLFVLYFNLPEQWQLAIAGFVIVCFLSLHFH